MSWPLRGSTSPPPTSRTGRTRWDRYDATALPAEWTDRFDVLATSLTFGNRMADNYAGDGTRRHTYRIGLGQSLQSHNTGGMQWGKRCQVTHRQVFSDIRRVLRLGGLALVEIKDHVRRGAVVQVTDWTRSALLDAGFKFTAEERIPSAGLGRRNGVATTGFSTLLELRRSTD